MEADMELFLRSSHLIFKLQNPNITKEVYTMFTNKDISQTAPNTGICPDWQKYYSDVKAALDTGRNDDNDDAEVSMDFIEIICLSQHQEKLIPFL
uniref:Uncharacterized protein n=1 Tax=Romanomermis culicivorax TaxID=13658 RepID=A0A915JT47_ROMCU